MTDNVVSISDAKPSLLPKKQKAGTLYCKHWRVCVDRHARCLECRDCGAIVDPFDYAMQCAEHEQAYGATAKGHREEIEQLNAERARLKGEISSLRSQLPPLIRRARSLSGGDEG